MRNQNKQTNKTINIKSWKLRNEHNYILRQIPISKKKEILEIKYLTIETKIQNKS